MNDKDKKAAAALAAVSCYLEMEESIRGPKAVIPVPQAQPSQWSHNGRQEMMAMRRLVQIRTFNSHSS